MSAITEVDAPLANVILDNCQWLHLSNPDRALLLERIRGFADPTSRRFLRIMHRAAYDADAPEQFRLLLDFGVPIDTKDVTGHNALSCATRAGNEAAVRYLLSRGAAPLKGAFHVLRWVTGSR